MIQIKCGTCGTSQGYKTSKDGALSLPISEEARLVSRGVADYATRPIIGAVPGVATPSGGRENTGVGENPPDVVEAPVGADDGGDAPDVYEGVAEVDGTLDIVDGHFTKESLMRMERKDMEALAADLGVDVKKCRNKGEIADLLAAVEVQPEDDAKETPPTLSPEDPVE